MNANLISAPPQPALFQILIAEDDPDHFTLFRRAVRRLTDLIDVRVARDGQEALNMLAAGDIAPRLVLLDINMPKLSGLEVLKAIKADARLAHIPVVILTTSGREKERQESQLLGADSFMTKHVNFKCFREHICALIESYLKGERPA
ncbi:response regulator [Myxococcota bacterium]|nr:response regulator [Myxococcota bacterium]MBU1430338.1 response regulator [Myxococcota bacterium]MBU1896389.1 response regulator [Myxococcota bacterium]